MGSCGTFKLGAASSTNCEVLAGGGALVSLTGGLFCEITKMSTLQLIHLIEQDLRALSNEARRRFADVKDAAERAMVALRSVQAKLPPSASPAEQGAAVAASQDVLMPFMLALASKSDTLPQMALGAVQRMISHAALAPHQMPAVISQLIARAQSPYEDEKALLACQLGTKIAGIFMPELERLGMDNRIMQGLGAMDKMRSDLVSRHQDVLDHIGENSALVSKIRQSQQMMQPYMA